MFLDPGRRLLRNTGIVFASGGFLCFLLACADGSPAPSNLRFDTTSSPFTSVTSRQNRAQLTIHTPSNQPLSRGVNSLAIAIVDEQGTPIEGVQLTVTPWMLNHGHGASVKPTVEPQADGIYVLTNVSFFMPGVWSLRIKMAGPLNDEAVVTFSIL